MSLLLIFLSLRYEQRSSKLRDQNCKLNYIKLYSKTGSAIVLGTPIKLNQYIALVILENTK